MPREIVSWGMLWRILFFVVLVAILYEGRQIILGLFLAIVISSGIEGVVDALERVGLPRSIGVILIFLTAILLIIFLLYSIVPLVIVELNTVIAAAQRSGSGTVSTIFASKASQSLSAAVSGWSSNLFSGAASPLDFLSNTVGGVGLALAVIVSSFYLSLSHDGVERFIRIVIPPDYEASVLKVYGRSRKLLGAWFRTQVLLTLIFGFTVWAGLALLGVKYAFLIGILAGLFEVVPFLGPILSGSVAVVSALTTSATLAIYTLIFFVIAEQFEANLLIPLLNQRAVGLHPVIVIIALLIGAEVAGILGIVIAVPAAAVFQEVVEEWSTKKRSAVASGLT